MFSRSLLTPILIIVAIGAPIVYHEQQRKNNADLFHDNPYKLDPSGRLDPSGGYLSAQSPWDDSSLGSDRQQSNGRFPGSAISTPMGRGELTSHPPTLSSQWDVASPSASGQSWHPPQAHTLASRNLSQRTNAPRSTGMAVEAISYSPQEPLLKPNGNSGEMKPSWDGNSGHVEAPANFYAAGAAVRSAPPNNSPLPTPARPISMSTEMALPYTSAMGTPMGTPDFGAAQVLYFPGNEFGPDLTAAPLNYLPVTDFREIFNFQITPQWIQSRWQRVSTIPQEVGLSGMRVALVTGPNSWDLQGSLTYYFDHKKNLQRISFRGWTGDSSRLESLVVNEFKFRAQETLLAGFYLNQRWRRQTGGLLMKYAPILDAEQPNQRLGVVLEINNPSGSLELSEEFRLLIAGSHGP